MRSLFVLGLALGVVACDASESDECNAGAVSDCTGASGCSGTRTCELEDGVARLGACICDDDPAPPAPDAAPPEPEPLGRPCTRDAQCPDGAFCLSVESDLLFGGAPPRSICVADCSTRAAACDAFEDAVCVPMLEQPPASTDDGGVDDDGDAGAPPFVALCLAACAFGSAEDKCHELANTACTPLAGEAGYCRPLCAHDSDCQRGVCDPKNGVCREDAPADTTLGLACNPALEGTDCDGVCATLNGVESLCSSRCVFGDASECAPATGGLRRGGCVFATPEGTIGDLGYCGELCDCNEDCLNTDAVCDAFDDEDLESAFGRKGVCATPALLTNRELKCEQ